MWFCEFWEKSGTKQPCSPFVEIGTQLGSHPTRKLEKHDKSENHQIASKRASEEELADPLFLSRTLSGDPVLQRTYPSIFYLLTLAALIPSSTACVERLFSLMNSLCTPIRSTLSQQNLDCMLRIVSGGEMRLSQNQLCKTVQNFKDLKERALKF